MHAPILSDLFCFFFCSYVFYVILTALICKLVRYIYLNIKPLKGSIELLPSPCEVQCPFLEG